MKKYGRNIKGCILAIGLAVLMSAGAALAQTTTTTTLSLTAVAAKPEPPMAPPGLPQNGEEVLEEWGKSTNSEDLQIKLNFRGASLASVLDYLSKAAGFIIVQDAVVEGTIDAYSHQPLNRDEVVELLNTILNDKGYAAVRTGRILKIVSKSDAKTGDLRVATGSDPDLIPQSDEMVHQIIPIRYASAMKLMDNLKPLLSLDSVMTANEDSNAILLTDTQTNIRRMARIIKALDTSISNISDIQVFPLQYADAEELSKVVDKVFEMPTGSSRSSDRSRMEAYMRMRSGGDSGRGSSGQQATGDSKAMSASTRVLAVADTRSNSLVVSAPEEVMPEIEALVNLLDTPSTDETEIKIFNLKSADAEELADLVDEVFSDGQSSSRGGRGSSGSGFADMMRMRFGGSPGGGPFGGGRPGGSSKGGDRQLAAAEVVAVADTRTNSLIVTASADMMAQIQKMVDLLDADPAMKQKVYVHDIQYADVEALRTILGNMFYSSNSRGSSSSSSRYGSQGSSRYPSSSSSRSSSSGGNSRFGSSSSSQRR